MYVCYSLHSFSKRVISIYFYHAFAEAHTCEIRSSAFCFIVWGVVLVEIVQVREKLWEMIWFGDVFCVAGTQSATFCSYFPPLWKWQNMGSVHSVFVLLYIFIDLFVFKA